MTESHDNYVATTEAKPLCPLLILAGAVNEAAYSTTSTMECIEGACGWWVGTERLRQNLGEPPVMTVARCGIAK